MLFFKQPQDANVNSITTVQKIQWLHEYTVTSISVGKVSALEQTNKPGMVHVYKSLIRR